MFLVVHFVTRDEVEVVPGAWLSGTTCRWPMVASRKVKKLVIKESLPDESWDAYKVVVKGVFATYEDVCRKLNIFQYTSDVNSDSGTSGKKRRRFVSQRFLEDASEDDCKQQKRGVPYQPSQMMSLTYS